MANVRTELVFAHKDGMESTVQSRDALEGKLTIYFLSFLMRTWTILLSILFRCSNQGQCRVGIEGLFECRCYDGFDGADCSFILEKDCKDGKDNDKGKKKNFANLLNLLKFDSQMVSLIAKIPSVAHKQHA